jgi:hypothetical protein
MPVLKTASGKCLHYYLYLIDPQLGLCYLRIPTWCPFKLQFYCNGHSLLAATLRKVGIAFTMMDNAFLSIDDLPKANALAEQLDVAMLHHILDQYVEAFCPVVASLNVKPHWSITQAEYSTDILFKRQEYLQKFYLPLVETLIHSVKPENIATFLGQKLHGNYQGEMGNKFNVRLEGTRVKHSMGPVSIKLYDKAQIVLRIETTVNDVTVFKQYRDVHRRTGESETKWTAMKKSIYSLSPLQDILHAANRRYLGFISQIDTPEAGAQQLEKITSSHLERDHSYKGFNPLSKEDAALFRIIARGEFCIHGLTSHALRRLLPNKTPGQISRLIKRLRVHGLLRKVGATYKYYLTELGQRLLAAALQLRECFFIPRLAWGANIPQ